MARPNLFIGSSSEGLSVADAISVHLEQVANTEIWNEGVFGLSHGTLEELVAALDRFEFAVLVVTPDDTLKIRDIVYQVPRDNVMFEAGLFMGRLGRRRVFVVAPLQEKAYLPSDLAGITVARYDPTGRSLSAATHSALALTEPPENHQLIDRFTLRSKDSRTPILVASS
jgi:predicted nucleotide-binding protein